MLCDVIKYNFVGKIHGIFSPFSQKKTKLFKVNCLWIGFSDSLPPSLYELQKFVGTKINLNNILQIFEEI